MSRLGGEFNSLSQVVITALDDLEREALAHIYQPPTPLSAEGAIQRFPMDEHVLNALQEVDQRVRTVVIDVRAKQNSDLPFFRGGLRQPLQ